MNYLFIEGNATISRQTKPDNPQNFIVLKVENDEVTFVDPQLNHTFSPKKLNDNEIATKALAIIKNEPEYSTLYLELTVLKLSSLCRRAEAEIESLRSKIDAIAQLETKLDTIERGLGLQTTHITALRSSLIQLTDILSPKPQ